MVTARHRSPAVRNPPSPVRVSAYRAVMRFEAVLFDWMLTLAHYPSPAEHVALALRQLGRLDSADEVSSIVDALSEAKRLPDVQAADAIEDTSAAAHRHSEYLLYRRAGLDDDLANALYGFLGDPSFHPCYGDAPHVLGVLAERDIKIGVISDIHVDLRVHAERFGIGQLIDSWALSFEHGIQKPDPRLFAAALDPLGVDPARTLMVGDRPSRDGAAADLGMTCLILPPVLDIEQRGLDLVLKILGFA